jgi:dTDP-4-amino-4,6-dideoxygalactose transaminase
MNDNVNLDSVRQFVRVKRDIEDTEERLERMKEERDQLAEIVANELLAAGLSSLPITVDGESVNVYTQQPLIVWRKEGVDTESLVETLKATGFEWMVKETVNQNTLQAEMRELLANGEKLPRDLADKLNIFQKTELRMKANTKAESASARAMRNLKG